MKKRVILILLALALLCAVLVGCGSSKLTCESCGNKVDHLVSRADNAGVTRTWCVDCWAEYDAIMGN
ncbi:MAG: hypothetical protein IIY79_04625 [Ruminococcus sp.]|nr:hypothetical protein [Ruminococcus sp.]